MIFKIKYILFIAIFHLTFILFAQTDSKKEDSNSKPSLDLTKKVDEKEEEKKKEKKPKKKFFYGLKTKRGFVRKGKDNKVEVELFYFVKKKDIEPMPFVTEIWWQDKKTRKLYKTRPTEKELPNARILHGPYRKKIGKIVLEEGVFYLGTKHARWEKYDRNNILLDKKKYYKGFAKDAVLNYYDAEQKLPKEIIPIHDGIKEGEYLFFDINGNLLIYGLYKDNVRIGTWTTFYTNKKKNKEILYPKDPYQKGYISHTFREWDLKGKVIFDSKKDGIRDTLNENE